MTAGWWAAQWLLAAGVGAAALSILAYTLRTGISPMPTLPAVRRTLLAALPAAAEVRGAVLELGAGWGSLALPLARRYPHASVRAVELSPLPWAVCRLRARWAGLRNLTVCRTDFLRGGPHGVALHDAGLVVCYLAPGIMARLRPRLEAELPPGAVVVSHTFAVPGWTPEATYTANDLHRSPVYVYRRPSG